MADPIEQTVMTDDQYEGLIKMLQSSDEQNAVVALHVMENCDFQKSLGRLLYLYKGSKCNDSLWAEHAPNLHKKLVALGVKVGEDITFENAFKILKAAGVPREHQDFLLSKFGKVIRDELASWGYDYIDEIKIVITLKDERL